MVQEAMRQMSMIVNQVIPAGRGDARLITELGVGAVADKRKEWRNSSRMHSRTKAKQ